MLSSINHSSSKPPTGLHDLQKSQFNLPQKKGQPPVDLSGAASFRDYPSLHTLPNPVTQRGKFVRGEFRLLTGRHLAAN